MRRHHSLKRQKMSRCFFCRGKYDTLRENPTGGKTVHGSINPVPAGGAMKKTISSLLFIIIMMIRLSAANDKPAIYNPDADSKQEIAKALIQAKAENKHVLLMFGANWCPWCHKLHELFQFDKQIRTALAKHYLVVMIDIGESKKAPLNRDLEEKYRVKGFGYPCLAVLDNEGSLLCAQSTGVLEKGQAHDPKRVLALFTVQAPHTKQ